MVTSSRWCVTQGLRAQTTHSFNEQSLSTDDVPGLAQGAGDTAVGKNAEKAPTPGRGKPLRSFRQTPSSLRQHGAKTPSARRVRNRARGPPATSADRPNAPEPTAVLRPGPRPQGLSRHRATPPVGRLRRRPLLHRSGIQVSVCVLTRQPQRSPRNPPPSHRSPARDASGTACCTCEQRARSLGARPGVPSSGTSPSDRWPPWSAVLRHVTE